jgi:hypothetical protein
VTDTLTDTGRLTCRGLVISDDLVDGSRPPQCDRDALYLANERPVCKTHLAQQVIWEMNSRDDRGLPRAVLVVAARQACGCAPVDPVTGPTRDIDRDRRAGWARVAHLESMILRYDLTVSGLASLVAGLDPPDEVRALTLELLDDCRAMNPDDREVWPPDVTAWVPPTR